MEFEKEPSTDTNPDMEINYRIAALEAVEQIKKDREDRMSAAVDNASSKYVEGLQKKYLKLMSDLQRWEQIHKHIGDIGIDLLRDIEALETEKDIGIAPSQLFGYFITIAPGHQAAGGGHSSNGEASDTKDIVQLLLKVSKKISKKAGVTHYIYAIEQTGDNMELMGQHPHVHILIQRNKETQSGEPRRLKKGLKQTIKSIYKGKDVNVQIKPVKDGTQESRIKYIKGIKSGPEKQNAVAIDKQWRKLQNVKEFYSNINGV